MATGSSLFTYGVPTTECGRLASIRRSLSCPLRSFHTAPFFSHCSVLFTLLRSSHTAPFFSHCSVLLSESLYRQPDSGEVCQWSVEHGGGPPGAPPDEVYLDLYVLEQHIDGDVIRTQLANPYASYSPNTFNVRAAIKAVADAAATMHVSNLIKQYNSRAERVFKATIAHMNSKNTNEFQALFYPMSIKGGGFVLLQPELSAVADSYFEKCEFPVQRSGVGKRIRLACSIEDPADGFLHNCTLFPALDTTQERRVSRQYRENRRAIAHHTQSTEGILAGKDDFPKIPISFQTYRVIAGSIQRVGGAKWDAFTTNVGLNVRVSLPTFHFHPVLGEPGSLPTVLPSLIRKEDMDELVQRYASYKDAVVDTQPFVAALRKIAEHRKAVYVRQVEAWLDHVNDALLYGPGAGAAAAAIGLAAGSDDDVRALTFFTRFFRWTMEHEDRYVLMWMPDAGFNMETMFINAVPPSLLDIMLAIEMRLSVIANPTVTDNDVAGYYPSLHHPGAGIAPIARGTGAAAVANTPPHTFWANRQQLPVTSGRIASLPGRETFVMLAKDLFDALEPSEFTAARAEKTEVDPRDKELTHPFAIESGYRPLIMRRDNEVRYKLSLLPNRGFNPAYFGGAKDDVHAAANLGVGEDDVRRDYDEAMKNWEFNLNIRSDQGYDEEWRATMQTVVQCLVTHAKHTTPDKLPTLDVIDLASAQPIGTGFVYVPFAPEAMRSDPKFRKNMVVPIRPVSQQQFVNTYPRWMPRDDTDAVDDVHLVSQASLFWYNNAVATATEPFSVRETGTNLDDVAAMLASSAPFAAMTDTERDLVQKMHAALCEVSPFASADRRVPAKTLHLIQITKASVAPGNSNFAQPFPPLRVHFKGAALEADSTAIAGVRLVYTLGCEATILVESMFVAVALLKQLMLEDITQLDNPYAAEHYRNIDVGLVPMVHTVGAMFPPPVSDPDFKESIVRGPMIAPLGFTRSFFVTESTDGVADMNEYVKFLGMGETAHRDGLMNKAGRYLFGPPTAEPRVGGSTTSGVGYFDHDFVGADPTDAAEDPIRFCRGEMDAPPGVVAAVAQDMVTTILDPNSPWTSILSFPGTFDHNAFTGQRTAFNPAPWTPEYEREFAAHLLRHRTTYDDYLAAEMLITENGGEKRVNSNGEWTHNERTVGGANVDRHHELVTIPAYRFDATKGEFMLLAYVHVGGELTINKVVVHDGAGIPIGYAVTANFAHAWITGVYAVRENILHRDEATGHVRFVADDVVLGLRLSNAMRQTAPTGDRAPRVPPTLARRRYAADPRPDALPEVVPFVTIPGTEYPGNRVKSQTPFLVLRVLAPGQALFKAKEEQWQISIDAFNRYRTHPRAATFSCRTVKDVKLSKIAKILKDGCQGYHYGNSMSLSATVFAVAVNKMYDDIHEWYSDVRGNPLMPGEPRAINVVTPGPGNEEDARLVVMIQKEEMRGAGSGATSTTSGTVLITPCVVEVRGPDPEALATPCYIDNVFVKTANFRVHEAQLVTMLYQRLAEIRSVQAITDRVPGCLGEHLERNKDAQSIRRLVQLRPQTVPLLAMIMIRLKNYLRISAETEKSRSNVAVRTAFKELMQDFYMVLFRM